jgi:peptide deformylase
MSETELKIRIIGDPVLCKKAKPVKQVTEAHRRLLSAMAQSMYKAKGIGLAAPQVGVSEQMIVADIGGCLYKLVNPRITKKEGMQAFEEGCLSVPGIGIKIKRAKKICVTALDEQGREVCVDAEDLLACVVQHEMDHLQGKLIVDYASLVDKIRLGGKLTRLKKQGRSKAGKGSSGA